MGYVSGPERPIWWDHRLIVDIHKPVTETRALYDFFYHHSRLPEKRGSYFECNTDRCVPIGRLAWEEQAAERTVPQGVTLGRFLDGKQSADYAKVWLPHVDLDEI